MKEIIFGTVYRIGGGEEDERGWGAYQFSRKAT